MHSETAILSALNSRLSLKASCEIKYRNVPVEAHKRDRIIGVALVVKF